jgi:hypothetical protein
MSRNYGPKKAGLFTDEYGYLWGFWVGMVITGSVLVLIAFCTAVFMSLSNHNTHVQCLRVSEETSLATHTVGHYNPSCYVNVGGHWVPYDTWINNRESS